MSDGVLGGDRRQTVGDSTRFDTERLTPEVYHEDIWYYRDLSDEYKSAYQLGFKGSRMPYGYRLPDHFAITHARVEYQHPPEWGWLRRKLQPGEKALCIIVSEKTDVWTERAVEELFR